MKRSQLERAVDALEAERAVLDLAILKLKGQQQAKAVRIRKPRAVEAKSA